MRLFFHGEGKNQNSSLNVFFGKALALLVTSDRCEKLKKIIWDDQHPRIHPHLWLCEQCMVFFKNYFYLILFS